MCLDCSSSTPNQTLRVAHAPSSSCSCSRFVGCRLHCCQGSQPIGGIATYSCAVSSYNWSGFYIGVNAGDSWGHSNATTNTAYSTIGYFAPSSATAVNANGAQTLSPKGIVGGIQAGYNWQAGHLVLGVELNFDDFHRSSASTVTVGYPAFAPTTFTISLSIKTNWLFTARPRLGLTMNNWLFNATGGLAVTNVKANFTFTDTFATMFENASVNRTKTDWIFGGASKQAPRTTGQPRLNIFMRILSAFRPRG